MKEKIYYIVLILIISSCSFVGSTSEVHKNTGLKLSSPSSKWEVIDKDKSDFAFHNTDSHSVIFINSMCRKYLNSNLKSYFNSLFNDVRDLEITREETKNVFEREALVIHASTSLDGVSSNLSVILFKKDRCLYDLVLINSDKANLKKEVQDLNRILNSMRFE